MLKPCLLFFPLVFSSVAVRADPESLYAEEDCVPCYAEPEQVGHFGAGGYFLSMCPLPSSPQVARRVGVTNYEHLTGTSIDSEELCFQTYHTGGFGLYAFCQNAPSCDEFQWELRGNFLAHRFDDDQTYTPKSFSFLQPSQGLVSQGAVNALSQAKARLGTNFRSISGEIGGVLDRGGPLFRLFAGVSYTDIEESLELYYTPESITSASLTRVRQLSRMDGIGPRVGFAANISVLRRLCVFADLSINLLFSKLRGSFEQETLIGGASSSTPEDDLRIVDRFCDNNVLTPGIDGQVGLQLEIDCWSCFALKLHAGYRAIHYWDAARLLSITTNLISDVEKADFRGSSTQLLNTNYGLVGWVIGGSLQF